MTTEEIIREQARKKARAMRYKKPVCRITFENIQCLLSEIQENTAMYVGELWDDDTLEELLGSEEDAFEFKMSFADLETECEQMQEAISSLGDLMYMDEDQAVATFDLFFPAAGGDGYGELYGYDEFEGDYYALDSDWERDESKHEAMKKLKRLTKDELIDTAGTCLRIARQYMALEYRYDCLSGALEILRGHQDGLLQTVKGIEEAYEKAEYAIRNGFEFDQSIYDLDQRLKNIPDRIWVE
jgi:hypothetical protein